MKQSNPSAVYSNRDVEQLLSKEVKTIEQQIKTYAIDLSAKNLPCKDDKLSLYISKIRAPFQNLLEKVHKKISAIGIASEIESITENYEQEEQTLKDDLEKTTQELRLRKKEVKELKGNLGHEIKHWNIALWCLFALTFSEILINFKIFLPISSNNLTAFIGALGIGISLFIICHVYKDILALFSTRSTKIIAGISIVALVTALLYSFARMRLSMIADVGETSTEHISEWNFVLLNLVLFLSGIALTVIYKPSKQVISDHQKHKKIADQIKKLQQEYTAADTRLASLTKEKNAKLDELKGIVLMSHHYERIVISEYLRVFALWCSEAIIARKDDETPKCFSETPEPLTTYFETIDIQKL